MGSGFGAGREATERLGPLTVWFFVLVVLASGGTGLTLLAWPGSTDVYFSWVLSPPAAAATIGGLYVASSVVFAWALTLDWAAARSLCVGVYGLTVPTLVATIVHDEVFDGSRWQSWAWWFLFVVAPPAITVVLVANRHRPVVVGSALPAGARAGFVVVAAVLGAGAMVTLAGPIRDDLSDSAPFALVGLTGAYLGAWMAFIAVQAAWAAWRNTRVEALVPAASLLAGAAGALVAAVRTWGDLADGRVPYLAALVTAAAAGALLLRAAMVEIDGRLVVESTGGTIADADVQRRREADQR